MYYSQYTDTYITGNLNDNYFAMHVHFISIERLSLSLFLSRHSNIINSESH